MKGKHMISKRALTSGVIFTGINVFDSYEKPKEQPSLDRDIKINLNETPELHQAGGYIYKKKLIIINTGDEYVALSAVCTHQQCDVEYEPDFRELTCPCNGSSFNLKGKVLNGPASKSLKNYNVKKESNILRISN